MTPEETFRQIFDFHRQLFNTFERCTGMSTSRMLLLSYLYESDEISQTSLQKRVGIDHAAITRHLKQFEAEKIVTRRMNPQDNRITLVQLTEYGRQQIEILRQEREHFLNGMMQGFSGQELRQLSEMLQRLTHNVGQL